MAVVEQFVPAENSVGYLKTRRPAYSQEIAGRAGISDSEYAYNHWRVAAFLMVQ